MRCGLSALQVGRVAMKALYLALALLVVAEPPKVERVKIPVHPKDLQICAAYVSQGAPRDVQWACKDASRNSRMDSAER
jgi:hypothetical protein